MTQTHDQLEAGIAPDARNAHPQADIVVTSHRGGVGVSTIAWMLAKTAAAQSLRPVIVRPGPRRDAPLGPHEFATCCDDLRHTPEHSNPVVVDALPIWTPSTRAILRHARCFVWVVRPDLPNIRTLAATKPMLDGYLAANRELQFAGFFVNRYDAADPLHRDALSALRQSTSGLLIDPPSPEQASLAFWRGETSAPPSGAAVDVFPKLLHVILRSGAYSNLQH